MNRVATRSGLRSVVKTAVGLMYRSRVRNSWSMRPEEFWVSQSSAFTRMYAFACDHVPYYREASGIYPQLPDDALAARGRLMTIPVLTKEQLRSENERFWSCPKRPLTSYHATSGTSGTPLRLAASLGERGLLQAIFDEWYARICGTRRPRTLYLSGFMTPAAGSRQLFWRDAVTGSLFLSIYSLSDANRQAVRSLLARYRPQLIYGYGSAVHELATLLEPDGWSGRGDAVAVVTSEVFDSAWRGTIEAQLCRYVYDLYGSQEGCHMALQCDAGRLHVQPLVGIIEIVDESGREVAPGETGRVLVTGLLRRSMPLIRYELGDLAESTGWSQDCPCGLAWPTIGNVAGRREDLVRTRDGRRIGYLCFHATKNLRGLRECQIVQHHFERFEVRIVPDAAAVGCRAEWEAAIRTQVEGRLGYKTQMEFRYIDEIPRGSRGKFRAVVVDDFA